MPVVFTPILIVFPGDNHADRSIAGEIAATLREEALETELHDLDTLPSLDRYGAVVIGSPLDGTHGRPQPGNS